MEKLLRWGLVGTLVALFSGTVNAGLIRLDAKSITPTFLSDFSITFDDESSDGLLQWSEIQSFSGVSFQSSDFFDTVESVPTITAVSVLSTNPAYVDPDPGSGFFDPVASKWIFTGSGGFLSVDESGAPQFEYELTSLHSVPVASSVALLGLGLTGLGFVRQRRIARN